MHASDGNLHVELGEHVGEHLGRFVKLAVADVFQIGHLLIYLFLILFRIRLFEFLLEELTNGERFLIHFI